MPLLDIHNRERLAQAVQDELDQHYAALTGYLYEEHKDDGTHAGVTADSINILAGPITLPNGATITLKSIPSIPKYLHYESDYQTYVNTPVFSVTGLTFLFGNVTLDGKLIENAFSSGMGYSTTYVPAWTSSGAAPDLGNSTVVGRYTRIGNTIIGRLSIVFGNTATFGTGSYRFSLPVASDAVPNAVTEIGGCLVYDAGGSPAYYVGRARQVSTTTVELILSDGGGIVGQTTPMTFVATDQIGIDFCYEVP